MTKSSGWDGDENIFGYTYGPYQGYGIDSYTSQSWYLGLQWSDVFIDGNVQEWPSDNQLCDFS